MPERLDGFFSPHLQAMSSRDGHHRTACGLLLLLGVAIGLHVYAVRVKQVEPQRRPPETSLGSEDNSAAPGSQSSRIQRLIRN